MKASEALSAALLTALTIFFGFDFLDVSVPTKTVQELSFLLFFALCFGAANLGLWKMASLVKKRVLCELVLAEADADEREQTVA